MGVKISRVGGKISQDSLPHGGGGGGGGKITCYTGFDSGMATYFVSLSKEDGFIQER